MERRGAPNFNKFFLLGMQPPYMAAKVVVYGFSTEGYLLARQMSIKGASVSLIDEMSLSAISLTPEIAKKYASVSSLKEDEPILPLEPIDVAISRAQYLFFAPRIRKIGQDTKTEICSKFKTATSPLKKNSSVIYCVPTGFEGNHENISFLEHVTGFEAGRTVSYYYYPLGGENPELIGSFSGSDEVLAELLSPGKKQREFVPMSSAEHFYAVDLLTRFSTLFSSLEVCKFAQDEQTKADLSSRRFKDVFLDDMVAGMYDLQSLHSSFDAPNTITYIINGSLRGIENYIKRLIDETRSLLKQNHLKASRTTIAVSWTMDKYEMRGDKVDMLRDLTSRLRDSIGDVAAYSEPDSDLFHNERIMVVLVCTQADFERIAENRKEKNLILIKANPLCEVVQ
ncbi:hypothetical protein CENSYa_1959 [Cenarchaeum symbiosum A]|uniref:Uncharacterized protein n=1 Tax=Cenarchaeum symbiosum (strain A) TaxID=414004 RepID=A0RYZ9_CENSY|nr:hypothetical protein CENSYa_1959 [Cenarchaeum symbiosum A]